MTGPTTNPRIIQHIEGLGHTCRGPQRANFTAKDFRPGVLANGLRDLLEVLGATAGDAVRPFMFALLYIDSFPFSEAQLAAFGEADKSLAALVTPILERMPDVPVADRHQFAADLDEYLRGAGCGYPLAKTILAHPLDGDERTYQCPQCGLTGSYRAPIESVLAAELERQDGAAIDTLIAESGGTPAA